jgi:hypothetical protein
MYCLGRRQIALDEAKVVANSLVCMKRRVAWMLAASAPLSHNIDFRESRLAHIVEPVQSHLLRFYDWCTLRLRLNNQ